jgi:NAD(P)-dependent dehydrogenase (short-subunit alcohol dehydrogenase family)/rhamnose utilization protein RhaD (predicted bifunctional aldolase and dehydrogenase)
MTQEINNLIQLSKYYGNNKDFVIASGGNSSFKTENELWITASGSFMGKLKESDLLKLSRKELNKISSGAYSKDPQEREKEVKNDLIASISEPEKGKRPSVETSLHNLIEYSYIVHTHPTLINGLLCSRQAEEKTKELFQDKALYIEYTDPGYTLFKKVEKGITEYREKHKQDPKLIFIQNHGIFVSANSPEEIRELYQEVMSTLHSQIAKKPDTTEITPDKSITRILPAIRMMISRENLNLLKIRNNSLIQSYLKDEETFSKIALPFTPDIIVFCKSHYLYINEEPKSENILESVQNKLKEFVESYGHFPKIIGIKNLGIIAAEDQARSAETMLDIYEDLIKISFYSENFGGPRFMNEREISFIEDWEVEKYRHALSKGNEKDKPVKHQIALVTGGSQGFGEGIVRSLFNQGVNVVIADIKEEKGRKLTEELNNDHAQNQVSIVQTDVTEDESVDNAIYETVRQYGGLDLLISNAGILKAGGLDEMDSDTFEAITKVNYKGYFICAKYASKVMKLQAEYNENLFMDIIQINSKSGLVGSKKNFAYAGSKFGGIGLTQSFALELIPYRIKVNSICPGNYFEGPLWSDPDNGLFVQYLKAGKVPGAKTVEEVKKHYESKIPAQRGCQVDDLMKAIYYVIDQVYETGQAIPVTGGQAMLK